MINKTLKQLDFYFIYVDDIKIYSTWENDL